MKVYLGGPITGLTYEQCTEWRDTLTNVLSDEGFEVRSPMREKEHLIEPFEGEPLPSRFDEEEDAVTRDLKDITECDIILVNLIGATRVSIGTMCELGYAKALNKHIVVVIEEESQTERSEGTEVTDSDNPHDHLFVYQLASTVVGSIEEALQECEQYWAAKRFMESGLVFADATGTRAPGT